jgi:ABC-type uncharacterized transport system permease subunit
MYGESERRPYLVLVTAVAVAAGSIVYMSYINMLFNNGLESAQQKEADGGAHFGLINLPS